MNFFSYVFLSGSRVLSNVEKNNLLYHGLGQCWKNQVKKKIKFVIAGT